MFLLGVGIRVQGNINRIFVINGGDECIIVDATKREQLNPFIIKGP